MKQTIETDSRKGVLTGRILSALAVLFCAFDAITKIILLPGVVTASAPLGYAAGSLQAIGTILLVCVVLYTIPRTALLGAVLLTGYLGGAVASNLRIGNPVFSHTLFPVYFGVLVWAGLLLRQRRMHEFFSLKKA